MIRICVAELGVTPYSESELSSYARQKLTGVTNAHRREEIICGEMLREAMLTPLSIDLDSVRTRDDGKPYAYGREDVSFSVSHSGSLAVGAVSTEGEVGIDLELCDTSRSYDRQNRIMRRAFSLAERRHVDASDAPTLEFYAVWTRKEAYLKKTGEGIATDLSAVDTESAAIDASFRTFRLVSSAGEGYICSLALPRGYDGVIPTIEKI